MPAIRTHIHRNIRKCDPVDLTILASIPRSTLIPVHALGGPAWDECILLDLPITRTNADALKTLATIFHGPVQEEITFPESVASPAEMERREQEAVYARFLTALFYAKTPTLFAALTAHMDTLAMQDNALASLSLISALITSTWSTAPLPSTTPPPSLTSFPATGLDMLLDPSISGGVLPSLLKPAVSFANLVGGRGDAENAAYVVAQAKFGVLKVLGRALEGKGRKDVEALVRKRVGEGVWGAEGGGVGSRIGTLEG